MNQQPEALILADDRPSAIGDDLYQWALDAEDMIRGLHTRVQELEKDLKNAKRLVSKVWNQHPEARDTIEKATGAWLVFGQDVENDGVSAQRAIDPIGKPSWDSHQWPQIVQDSSGNWFGVRDGWTMRVVPTYKGDELWLLREDGEFLSHGECSHGWRTSLEKRPTTQPAPVVLPDGWKIAPVEPTPQMVEAGATERITPHITAGHGAIAAFKAMLEHAPECPALASTPASAQMALPEPEAEVVECSGDCPFQDGTNNEISAHLPVGPKLYTDQQVLELLAAHGITQEKRSNAKEEQQWQ